jgi:annexin A7/11
MIVQMLYKSMKGMGTHDETLIRVIVTRAEMDMQLIKAEFRSKYKKNLEDVIASETSGSYKKFLLALVGSSNH